MMDNYQAEEYLQSLLGKTLRVHTTDTRMFVGSFKCTDAVCSLVLVNLVFTLDCTLVVACLLNYPHTLARLTF